jgi:hypothetical protein
MLLIDHDSFCLPKNIKAQLTHSETDVHSIQVDLTPSCLSSTTVKVKSKASESTISLRKANQSEAVLAAEFTQTCLTIFMGPRIHVTVQIPPLLRPIYIVRRII